MATPEDQLLPDEGIGFGPPNQDELERRMAVPQDNTAVIGQTTEAVRQGEALRDAFRFGEGGRPAQPAESPDSDAEVGETADPDQRGITTDQLRDRLPEQIQEHLGRFADPDQERILQNMIREMEEEAQGSLTPGGDEAIPAIEEVERQIGRRGPTSTPEGPDPGTPEARPIGEEEVGTGFLDRSTDLFERGVKAVGGAVAEKAADMLDGLDQIVRGQDREMTVEDFPGMAIRGAGFGLGAGGATLEKAGEVATSAFLAADELEDTVMRAAVQSLITEPIRGGSDFVSAATGLPEAGDEVADRIEILLPEESDNAFYQTTEEMLQLGFGFIGWGKALNTLGKATGFGKVTDLRQIPGMLQRAARGGLTEAMSENPETPRLADWVGSMNIPVVSEGFAMLEPGEDDSDAVARIKRGLEGVFLESTIEAMIGQWRVMHGLNRWIEAPGPAARTKALEEIEVGIDQFQAWQRAAPDAVAPGQRVKVTQARDGAFEITRVRDGETLTGELRTRELTDDSGTGFQVDIRDPDGNVVARAEGTALGEKIEVGKMVSPDGEDLGIGAIRQVARQLRDEFPDANTIAGFRQQAGEAVEEGIEATGRGEGRRVMDLDKLAGPRQEQVVFRAQTRGQAESVAASLDQLLKYGKPRNPNRFGSLSDEQADMVMRHTRAAVRRAQAKGISVTEEIGSNPFFNFKTLNNDESVAVVDAMARVMADEMEKAKGSVTIKQMREEAETIIQGFDNSELPSVMRDRLEDFQGMHAWVLAAHTFMASEMESIGRATLKLGQAGGDRVMQRQIREKMVGIFQMTNMLNGAESEAGRTLRAIRELTEDPSLTERLGRAGRDRAERQNPVDAGSEVTDEVSTGFGEHVAGEVDEVIKSEEGPGLLGQLGLTVDDLKSAQADRKIRAAVMDASDETIGRLSAMIRMAEHPREMIGVSKAFRIIKKDGAGSKAFNFFMNNILSGLRTQATIATSAATMGTFQPLSKIMGGYMLKALPGPRNSAGDKLIRLGAEEMHGNMMYLQDGARMMGRALRAGHSFIGGRTTRRVAESTAGQALTEWVPRWMGSVDEMIRQVRYRSIVRAKAMENFRAKGYSGDELVEKAEEIVAHSFDEETGEALFKGMLDEATVATFSNPLGQASLSKSFADMIHKNPMMRWLVPFTRAPANLMVKAWEISPPGSFLKETVRNSLLKNQEEAGRVLGENFIGSMIGGFALWGTTNGFITGGGPHDRGMKQVWEQNHDRYAFHFENEDGEIETISYRRFEPFTIPLSVLADVTEGLMHARPAIEGGRVGTGEVVTETIGRFAASALDRTYLTTLNDMILGTVGGERYKLTQALSKVAVGATTPYSSLLRSINPDQHFRDTEGLVDSWKANIPGFSEQVTPRFNAFGEKLLNAPTKKQGTMAQITDTFNPFQHRVRDPSPLAEVMWKIRVGRPPKDPQLATKAPNGDRLVYADLKDEGLKSNPDQPLPWVRFNEILREGVPEEGLPPMKEGVRRALQESDLNLEQHAGNSISMGGPLAEVIRPLIQSYYAAAEGVIRSEYPLIQQQYSAIQKAKANAMAGQDDPRELDAIIDSVQRSARAQGSEAGLLPSERRLRQIDRLELPED